MRRKSEPVSSEKQKLVFDAIYKLMQVSSEEILSHVRHGRVSTARHWAMWLLYTRYNYPLLRVAPAVGRGDHTVVRHGIRKINEMIGRSAVSRQQRDGLQAGLDAAEREMFGRVIGLNCSAADVSDIISSNANVVQILKKCGSPYDRVYDIVEALTGVSVDEQLSDSTLHVVSRARQYGYWAMRNCLGMSDYETAKAYERSSRYVVGAALVRFEELRKNSAQIDEACRFMADELGRIAA